MRRTPANGQDSPTGSTPVAKTGRKLIPIDPKVVEGMASVGATDREIGAFVGCDGDTIGRRFAEVLAKARSGLQTRLRQAQLKLALKGNATMLIWLGKQMLGQKEPQQSHEVTGAAALTVVIRDESARE
jgi:hypothetical protein